MTTATVTRQGRVDRSEHQQRRRRRVLSYVALAFFAVVFLFPLVFMFVSSLKPDAQILTDARSLDAFLPVGDISLNNYRDVFDRVPVARFMLNSVLITTLIVLLGLVVN